MNSDVVSVRALADYQVEVVLRDGRQGVFDMKPHLDFGVFRELREHAYFRQVQVVLGAVSWPHGQDIAPQTLLARLEVSQQAPSDA